MVELTSHFFFGGCVGNLYKFFLLNGLKEEAVVVEVEVILKEDIYFFPT